MVSSFRGRASSSFSFSFSGSRISAASLLFCLFSCRFKIGAIKLIIISSLIFDFDCFPPVACAALSFFNRRVIGFCTARLPITKAAASATCSWTGPRCSGSCASCASNMAASASTESFNWLRCCLSVPFSPSVSLLKASARSARADSSHVDA